MVDDQWSLMVHKTLGAFSKNAYYDRQNAKEYDVAHEQTVWTVNDWDSSSDAPVVWTSCSSSSKTMSPGFEWFWVV